MARTWHQRLHPGALGGKSVAHFSVNPTGSQRVWLVATDGTLWEMDGAGAVALVDGSRSLKRVADVAQHGVLAIDNDNDLLSRSGSQWVQRVNPGGPADPFHSITGDGSGRGWLTTRDGRVFTTTDGGATFAPDSSGFGPSSDPTVPKAIKTCFANEPEPTRWYQSQDRRVWRRGQFDPHPQVLSNVPELSMLDISVGPDGLLWLLREFGGVATLPPDGFGSPAVVAGGEGAFMVVGGRDATAWIAKSDGSLWQLQND
jgi:hypothetical protein